MGEREGWGRGKEAEREGVSDNILPGGTFIGTSEAQVIHL